AVRDADPDFIRALTLLREAQVAGAVGMRIEEGPNKSSTSVVFFRADDLSPEMVEKCKEIRRLLRLPPEGKKYALVYSPVPGAPGELAVKSRSMLQIMEAFA